MRRVPERGAFEVVVFGPCEKNRARAAGAGRFDTTRVGGKMPSQVFDVPDAHGNGLLMLLLLVPAVLSAVLAAVLWPRPLRLEVRSNEIAISGSVYGRTLPRQALELQRARVVDLSSEPSLTPVRRRNGIGLADYQVGWFRLRDGQKALCFLTRRNSVLYLPTKQGFALLLSTSEPEQVLAALTR